MKKVKVNSYILLFVFVVCLFVPQLFWLALPDTQSSGESENRELASFPAFSLGKIETWPASFEAWYNDHLPFRDRLIELYNGIQYFGFRTSANEDVVIGKGNWLFYSKPSDGDAVAHYTGDFVYTDTDIKAAAKNLVAFRDRLAEQGCEFILFIAPNKERVYAENMPAYYGKPVEDYPTKRLVDYLLSNTDLRVVYVYNDLMEEKEIRPEQWLYYSTDTHWNTLGGYVGSRALLAEMGIEIPPLSECKIVDKGAYSGDLANMLKLGNLLTTDREYQVTGYPSHAMKITDNSYFGIKRFFAEGGDSRKLLLIRDSYCDAMQSVVAPQFGESVLVHFRGYTPDMIEVEKPDIVVFQLVERSVKRLSTYDY